MDLLDDLFFEDDDEEKEPTEEEVKDASEWRDLVSSYAPQAIVEAEPETNPLARFFAHLTGKGDDGKSPRKSMFSRQQQMILGVLIVLVLIVYVVMGSVVIRSYRQQTMPADAGNLIGLVADTSVDPSPTEPSLTATTEATSTPIPTPTLPPSEQVSTSFDLQLERDPGNAALHVERGFEYLAKGAYLAAYQDFTKAVDLGDTSLKGQLGLGLANYHLMHWDAAEESFKNALDTDRTAVDVYMGLARLYYYEGDYQRASNAFDAVAELDRQHPEAEAWLAICAGNLGDADEAAGAATRAFSRTQESAIVYIAQSWAKRTQNPPDLEGAHGDLLYANGLEPNNFFSLNELTRFYLEYRPERIGEAERFANWAINWAPDIAAEAVGHQTLGRVYLAQNRQQAALKEFQIAADLATDNGRILIAGLEDDLAKAQP